MTLKSPINGALALSLIIILTVACSRADGTESTSTADLPPAAGNSMAVTFTPEPTPTATPTPEPTPVSPGVVIADQPLDESGTLVADQVSLPGPGWLVIYRTINGEPDDVIGRQPLAAGVHEDVRVVVDTRQATEQLWAGVHIDAGAEGVFEFPGEDTPYPNEPETGFGVELRLPRPQLEVADQSVTEDGVVTLAKVEALEPTWVVIHADENGQFGPVIGRGLIGPGEHENVPVTIDWRRATPLLYAVLHEDGGENGLLEYPEGDLPILWNGQPIVYSFNATYPPEVLVYDQPVIDGTVSIERAISDGPGWLVIYNEIEGQPGFIIGTAALEDGLNEAVTVSLRQSAITPQLFARIHLDTEPGDAFNFPGQDTPVLYNGRMPVAAAFRNDAGAHAFVFDQPLGDDGTVTIDTVISPVDVWAVIYADEEGQPDAVLGQTWLPAGVNRDVVVDLTDPPAEGDLYLVLHQDLGEAEQFETPGTDTVLSNSDGRPIRIPFSLK